MCSQRRTRFYHPTATIIWSWSPPAPEKTIQGMCGLQFAGARHYSTLEGEIDTLLVPGVQPEKVQLSPAVLRWFRSRASKCRRVGSICTGAYILAQAGLLDGKRAATHWAFVSEFSSRFPKVSIDGNPIWIRDGNIYSSAGVTSGIDLSLALVEEDHGQRVALEVARMLVVFLCRPGNQAQFSVSLREQRTDNRPLRDLQVWIVENLQRDLSTPALAARVAMSERNFQRVFTREIGKPPRSLCRGDPPGSRAAKARRYSPRIRRNRVCLRLQQRGCNEPVVSAPSQNDPGRVSCPLSHQRRPASFQAQKRAKRPGRGKPNSGRCILEVAAFPPLKA